MTIDRRLSKLEGELAELQARGESQELPIVRVETVDREFNPPILVIQPGYLDLLRPTGSRVIDPALGG